jgi:hypothetical protein
MADDSGVLEQCYDDPANPVVNQTYDVGEPDMLDDSGVMEQCYDDPENPAAMQSYDVGEPNWND